MNTLMGMLSAVSSAIICAAAVWAILSEHVNDRIVVKVGLILLALGFASVCLHAVQELLGADAGDGLLRSVLLVNAGLAVVVVSVATRLRSADPDVRRITDWGALDSQPQGQHDQGQ